jgi:hypothetical protein
VPDAGRAAGEYGVDEVAQERSCCVDRVALSWGVLGELGVSRTPVGGDGELAWELEPALGALAGDRLPQGGRVDVMGDGDDDQVDEVLLAAGRTAAVVGDGGADLVGDLGRDRIEGKLTRRGNLSRFAGSSTSKLSVGSVPTDRSTLMVSTSLTPR